MCGWVGMWGRLTSPYIAAGSSQPEPVQHPLPLGGLAAADGLGGLRVPPLQHCWWRRPLRWPPQPGGQASVPPPLAVPLLAVPLPAVPGWQLAQRIQALALHSFKGTVSKPELCIMRLQFATPGPAEEAVPALGDSTQTKSPLQMPRLFSVASPPSSASCRAEEGINLAPVVWGLDRPPIVRQSWRASEAAPWPGPMPLARLFSDRTTSTAG